jgi:Divergent InlB B-repeat domain
MMQRRASQSRTSTFRVAAATIAAIAIALSSQLAAPPAAQAAWTRNLTIDFYRDVNFGDGRGRVTSDDGAIDCSYDGGSRSGDCSEHYILPDFQTTYVVQLTLDPGVGSSACVRTQFGCSAEGVTLFVDVTFARASGGDVTETPSFTRAYRKIVGNTTGSGNIRIDAGTACTPPANYEFCALRKYGDMVTLSAVPDPGTVFSYFHGVPCPETTSACEFQLVNDMNVFAAFGRVRLSFDVTGSGKLCEGGSCIIPPLSVWAPIGDTFAIEAEPASGWHFDHWSGPCAGQGRACSFTVQSTATAVATFARNATPKPTVKPTARPTATPTSKPTSKPTANPTPTASTAAPSLSAVAESPAPAESGGAAPVASSGTGSSTPPVPRASAGEPARSNAPGTPGPTNEGIAPGAGSQSPGSPLMPFVLLALLAAIGTVFLGFAVGRRARRAA